MPGALMIQNIQPGPQMMVEHPELFWELPVSFATGNLLLLILNIPLIGVWVKFLSVPDRLFTRLYFF
jgi:TctA family transporter